MIFGPPLALLVNSVGVFADESKVASIAGLVISGLTCLGLATLIIASVL